MAFIQTKIIIDKKQKEVYDFIVKFMTENGYSPSVREICAQVGFQSTSSANRHLWQLHDIGLITMKEKDPRTIALTGYKLVKVDDIPPVIGK